MPWGLKRFQQTRQIHFLTFSCYHRQQKFIDATARDPFVSALERVREKYGLCIYGYVVMPEHVYLLVSEPDVTRQVVEWLSQPLRFESVVLRAASRLASVCYHKIT